MKFDLMPRSIRMEHTDGFERALFAMWQTDSITPQVWFDESGSVIVEFPAPPRVQPEADLPG